MVSSETKPHSSARKVPSTQPDERIAGGSANMPVPMMPLQSAADACRAVDPERVRLDASAESSGSALFI